MGAPPRRRARTDLHGGRLVGDNECRARRRLVSWDRVGAFTVMEYDLQYAV